MYIVIPPAKASELHEPHRLKSDKFLFTRPCVLYESDMELQKDLNHDFLLELCEETGNKALDIIFRGNLTVNGRINLIIPGNLGLRLFVFGNVYASTLENDFSLVQICGDAEFQHLIYGVFPQGLTEIRGRVTAPFVINSTAHEFRMGSLSDKCITIKTYHDHEREDWENLPDLSNISYQLDGYLENLMPQELVDWDNLIVERFIQFQEKGKPVLKAPEKKAK
jgi:hypothetical protein